VEQSEDYQMAYAVIIFTALCTEQFQYFALPKISDPENDNVEIEIMDKDNYPYLELDGGGDEYVLEIDKNKITLKDYGLHMVELELKDDSDLINTSFYYLALHINKMEYDLMDAHEFNLVIVHRDEY